MSMPGIPDNINDRVTNQHKGIIHLAFGVDSMAEVEQKAIQLKRTGFPILSGPGQNGDGYYELKHLIPDRNWLEVTCPYSNNI